MGGSGISWAICKSASRSRQTTTPAPHYSSFLQSGCPSCRPTNSVNALKAIYSQGTNPKNLATIGPLDFEIIGLTEITEINKQETEAERPTGLHLAAERSR